MKTMFNSVKEENHMTGKGLLLWFLILTFMPQMVWAAVSIEDSDINDHVEQEFKFDSAVPFNSIDVKTSEGVVTLSGSVTNLMAKERAKRIAQTVRGVRSVINQIKVDPLLDRSAKKLRDSVEKALMYDAATDSYEIKVQTDDKGNVTLDGSVDSWTERNLAGKVAKSVTGVVNVKNQIGFKKVPDRPDAEIRPEIEQRLRWDMLVDHGLIDVSVNEGEVSLSGVVGSAAEKQRAELDAWVSGVKSVDASDLKVEKWARDEELREQKYAVRPDLEILSAVQDALLYDPRVNSFNLDIKVTNGYITLRGVVDNIAAKKAAVSDARNTVGVVRVNDLIKVRPLSEFDDEAIATDVRAALLRNPVTESYEINVAVDNGVVRLSGVVDTYYEKGVAENVAQRASGVVLVRNYLVVSEPGVITYNPYVYDWSIYDFSWYDDATFATNKSDWEIKLDIEDELLWSPFVDVNDIDVTVNAGVATLTGTVESWMEYNSARENAYDGGAIAVINKINVVQ